MAKRAAEIANAVAHILVVDQSSTICTHPIDLRIRHYAEDEPPKIHEIWPATLIQIISPARRSSARCLRECP